MYVEVHQEADRKTREAQVGHDLRLVDRKQALDGLELEENFVLDDDVESGNLTNPKSPRFGLLPAPKSVLPLPF